MTPDLITRCLRLEDPQPMLGAVREIAGWQTQVWCVANPDRVDEVFERAVLRCEGVVR